MSANDLPKGSFKERLLLEVKKIKRDPIFVRLGSRGSEISLHSRNFERGKIKYFELITELILEDGHIPYQAVKEGIEKFGTGFYKSVHAHKDYENLFEVATSTLPFFGIVKNRVKAKDVQKEYAETLKEILNTLGIHYKESKNILMVSDYQAFHRINPSTLTKSYQIIIDAGLEPYIYAGDFSCWKEKVQIEKLSATFFSFGGLRENDLEDVLNYVKKYGKDLKKYKWDVIGYTGRKKKTKKDNIIKIV